MQEESWHGELQGGWSINGPIGGIFVRFEDGLDGGGLEDAYACMYVYVRVYVSEYLVCKCGCM